MKIILSNVFDNRFIPILRQSLIDIFRYYGIPGARYSNELSQGTHCIFTIKDLTDPERTNFEEGRITTAAITPGHDFMIFPTSLQHITESLRSTMVADDAELLYYAREDPLLPSYVDAKPGESFNIKHNSIWDITYSKGRGTGLSIEHNDNEFYTSSYVRMKRIKSYENQNK